MFVFLRAIQMNAYMRLDPFEFFPELGQILPPSKKEPRGSRKRAKMIDRDGAQGQSFVSLALVVLGSRDELARIRAETAVIAWMRHQTTGYDGMVIPRVKGKRREVRRMLARRSHELLDGYRRGEAVGEECPLKKALATEQHGSTASDVGPF